LAGDVAVQSRITMLPAGIRVSTHGKNVA
jgi:hypothetical protein